jgi:amino acid transporter
MAVTEQSPDKLQRGQLGLFGVIMPGLAQVAPAFDLFFTTGVMVALAGAWPSPSGVTCGRASPARSTPCRGSPSA